MTKYSKVYLRNKKQSNISLPLRFSFLRSIFVDKMTVKHAALKWKIHYSSAKMIARLARTQNMHLLFKEYQKPSLVCGWQELTQNNRLLSKTLSEKENSGCESADSFVPQNMAHGRQPRIQITSTIGWNYLGKEGQNSQL